MRLLKIDRSYTSQITSSPATHAIVDTIRELAERLDMRVIAEGVETVEERDHLLEMGVSFAQGYLLARPCDEETFLNVYAPMIAVAPLT